MSASAVSNQHPRFGFNPIQLIPGGVTLANASLVSVAVSRTAGLLQVCVAGTFTLAGTGTVNMILEGSNDATNWVTLGQLDLADLFDTTAQIKILDQVDVEHWDAVRVRTVIVAGAPVFSLAVVVSGIHRDSEKFLLRPQASYTDRTVTPITRVAVGTNAAPAFARPRGTKFTNIMVTAAGLVLDGGTSYDATLQGSPDFNPANPGAATWFNVASAVITANGSFVVADASGTDYLDLSCYAFFRIAVVDVGGPGGLGAYSMNFWLSLDSVDWILADVGASAIPNLNIALLEVVFGTPGVEAAQTIVTPFAVIDADGAPLPGARRVEFLLSDTTDAGNLDLALVAVFSAVDAATTALSALSSNRLAVETFADGTGTISVLDAGVETVFLTAVQPGVPLPARQLIWASAEATLAFT